DKMAINISISDAAYKVLLREKRENESISDVILRITGSNLRIADVVGTNILKEEDWNRTKLDLKKLNKITLKKLEGI
ncbi:MAG: antitoxin VapB family protein, partial [Methanosarcinales archaeon]